MGGGIANAEEKTVTFTANTDTGSSTSQTKDEISKDGITISCTSAAFATSQYRFYAGSTTTVSSTVGIITKVEITGQTTKNPVSNFSIPTTGGVGTYTTSNNVGTWTGEAATFKLTAKAQARVSKIVVTYNASETTKIKTSLSFADPTDKTFNLNATEGTTFTNAATLTPTVEGATISYASDNEDVAIVDENSGEVLVSTEKEGKATITATYAGDDTYQGSTASYTITVKDPNQPKWVKTDLSALTSTDQFVIVDLTSKKAMSNDNGTNKAPSIVAITLNDDGTELIGDVADNIKWNLSATDGSYTFYPNGTTDSWLYVSGSSSNNNLRVGKGDYKTFTAYASGNYSGLKGTDGTNDRYIHVYSNQDWRTYKNATSTSTSIAYFKRVAQTPATNITLDENADNTIAAADNANVTLKRTFKANAWNTLVLPFDMTAEQITSAFGTDAKVANFTGTTQQADGTYTLNFNTDNTITANIPVFIYGAKTDGDVTINGVKVVSGEATSTPGNAAFSFVGTYTNGEIPTGDWFINGNVFYRAADTSNTTKALRATFRPTTTASAAKGLKLSVDGGTPTAISNITADGITVDDNAPIYNLNGQRVAKDYKGIVVSKGHKYINR